MRYRLHELFGWHAWVPVRDFANIAGGTVVIVICKCGIARYIGAG